MVIYKFNNFNLYENNNTRIFYRGVSDNELNFIKRTGKIYSSKDMGGFTILTDDIEEAKNHSNNIVKIQCYDFYKGKYTIAKPENCNILDIISENPTNENKSTSEYNIELFGYNLTLVGDYTKGEKSNYGTTDTATPGSSSSFYIYKVYMDGEEIGFSDLYELYDISYDDLEEAVIDKIEDR